VSRVVNVVEFVGIKTETAVRHVATSYPHDSYGGGALSLRENVEEITRTGRQCRLAVSLKGWGESG